MVPTGWTNSGCVFVMLIAGAGAGAGRGKTLIRAVSFFGPRLTDGAIELPAAGGTGRAASPSIPGGFGNGWRRAELLGGVVTGGRRGKTVNVSAAASAAGIDVIVGGNRRIGVTGVRVGRTMRVVSRFSTLGAEPACSGPAGSEIRTVSFFGSSMGGVCAQENGTNARRLSLVYLFCSRDR